MWAVASRILLALCISSACAAPAAYLTKQQGSATKSGLQTQAVSVVKTHGAVTTIANRSSAISTVAATKDYSTYAMLLAALALMAVIAIRRYRSGRP